MSNDKVRQKTAYAHTSIEEQRWLKEGGRALDQLRGLRATDVDSKRRLPLLPIVIPHSHTPKRRPPNKG